MRLPVFTYPTPRPGPPLTIYVLGFLPLSVVLLGDSPFLLTLISTSLVLRAGVFLLRIFAVYANGSTTVRPPVKLRTGHLTVSSVQCIHVAFITPLIVYTLV